MWDDEIRSIAHVVRGSEGRVKYNRPERGFKETIAEMLEIWQKDLKLRSVTSANHQEDISGIADLATESKY